jgi:hypothetical protein
MRYLFGLLCVCALGTAALGGCAWEWDKCEGVVCRDDNECTSSYCQDGSCVTEPLYGKSCYDDGLSGVCFDGTCVELAGDCTAEDFEETKDLIPTYNACVHDPLLFTFRDCREAWADAFDGAEPECVDFVTSCYLQNPEATLTRECSRCWALGPCCHSSCGGDSAIVSSCIDQQHVCMFGMQVAPSGGGGGVQQPNREVPNLQGSSLPWLSLAFGGLPEEAGAAHELL